MSKKGTIEVFQTKISRNDRFAQMSHQEKLIEQKKREIQAKLEQKKAGRDADPPKPSPNKIVAPNKISSSVKPTPVDKERNDKKAFNFNTFSNDGSFLNQFKQMKEKKLKPFSNKPSSDRCSDNDRNNKNKWKKDTTPPTMMTNKDNRKPKTSRFNAEPKINITTSYSNLICQQSYEPPVVTAQDVTGQPLLKNLLPSSSYPPPTSVPPLGAPSLLMSVPPPQIQLIPSDMSVDLCPTTVITTVTLPPQSVETNTIITVPPPCLPPLELTSLPPPNSMQVHSIPQADPMTTLSIPPPSPLQVANIPPPSPIQLNEIPNPKPMDLHAIPTPKGERDAAAAADFIKNVPPPNKSVPPPSITDNVPTCIPPPNVMPPTSMPPPQAGNINILVAQVPQVAVTQIQLQQLPPPPIVTQPVPQPLMNTIPPLMAQPILPPPSMGIVPPPQINVPPPGLLQQGGPLQLPPPGFGIPVNVPPPQIGGLPKDITTGSADYEAMASLGRMVAQCGPGIEDVVRQRKNQDPSLWFLFDKNSAAYHQYQQMVQQFKAELTGPPRSDQDDYKPEDIYESDLGGDDFDMNDTVTLQQQQQQHRNRKRKSRWGEKVDVPPSMQQRQQQQQQTAAVPPVMQVPPPILPSSTTGVMLSKITRHDPGFLAYVRTTYGVAASLTEETWKKAEDNYKVHLVYQEMLKKKQEMERRRIVGRQQYDYDSDEETDGGTWEHKQRQKEMASTQQWATDLTRQADGKHHIGDFLPPEELKKWLCKGGGSLDAPPNDQSDYSEHKLGEENKGFKMLQKLGWSEGKGLGTTEKGMLEPVNKGFVSRDGQGLGNQEANDATTAEDEYDAYRKRMMLAYKFRPNPLNNPRRAYY